MIHPTKDYLHMLCIVKCLFRTPLKKKIVYLGIIIYIYLYFLIYIPFPFYDKTFSCMRQSGDSTLWFLLCQSVYEANRILYLSNF